jgi:ATP-dependent Clp protease ATP-binding subunit ClpA
VIPRVVSALQRGELGLTTSNRPRGSFLFLGPTGVGKTELSLAFTDYLSGKDKLVRFDMSEYQTQESVAVLLGGRVGETGLLGIALAKSNTGTLLFDEIEKANRSFRSSYTAAFIPDSAPDRCATLSKNYSAVLSQMRFSSATALLGRD